MKPKNRSHTLCSGCLQRHNHRLQHDAPLQPEANSARNRKGIERVSVIWDAALFRNSQQAPLPDCEDMSVCCNQLMFLATSPSNQDHACKWHQKRGNLQSFKSDKSSCGVPWALVYFQMWRYLLHRSSFGKAAFRMKTGFGLCLLQVSILQLERPQGSIHCTFSAHVIAKKTISQRRKKKVLKTRKVR